MTINTVVAADKNAPPITRLLAEFIATHPSRGWGDEVEAEAHRSFLNWMGCAIGAAKHPAVECAIAAMQILSPAPQAAVLGRSERLDIGSAALVNGIASHTFDYDDTHATTLIHPSGPVISAVLALAEHMQASGRETVDAIVIGIDVACRVGLGMYPEHYDRGWHITGTTGPLGAAAGCARLLKLDVHQTMMALGLAASQPIGLREQFGSMGKPFHPGAAARSGLMAALLAQKGYTASEKALEAPRGYFQVISSRQHWHKITAGMGQRFEIMANTYKPFACGVVIHPSIDGCVQLRAHAVAPEDIDRIELRVHSLVLELTGKASPKTGLEGKFSVYHGCAAGYVFGRAGEAEFSDEIVNRSDLVSLRAQIQAMPDDRIAEASAEVTLVAKDGRRWQTFIEHASGSVYRPMGDAQLDSKFEGQVAPILGPDHAANLLAGCRNLAGQTQVNILCVQAQP